MSHATAKKKTKRKWRFRGICADAAALGVTRQTLHRVLIGEWVIRGLSARYAELKASQAKAATKKTRKAQLEETT